MRQDLLGLDFLYSEKRGILVHIVLVYRAPWNGDQGKIIDLPILAMVVSDIP